MDPTRAHPTYHPWAMASKSNCLLTCPNRPGNYCSIIAKQKSPHRSSKRKKNDVKGLLHVLWTKIITCLFRELKGTLS